MAGVAALVAGVVAVVVALPHVHHSQAAPLATASPPKPFRIVFPEGFTRAQMAVRVHDVATIAQRKSRKPVKLDAAAYLRASTAGVDPVLPAAQADEPRGVPVPGDVRLPEHDDRTLSSSATS